jgi:hypothetical protein
MISLVYYHLEYPRHRPPYPKYNKTLLQENKVTPPFSGGNVPENHRFSPNQAIQKPLLWECIRLYDAETRRKRTNNNRVRRRKKKATS